MVGYANMSEGNEELQKCRKVKYDYLKIVYKCSDTRPLNYQT